MSRVALIALVLLVPLALAKAPTMTATYVGQPAGGGCGEVAGQECPQLQNSKVEFGPFAPPRNVDIRVVDAVSDQVGSLYTFYSASGAPLSSDGLCGSAARLRAPPGAAYLTVAMDTPANLGMHCDGLVAAYGTAGEVTLRLR